MSIAFLVKKTKLVKKNAGGLEPLAAGYASHLLEGAAITPNQITELDGDTETELTNVVLVVLDEGNHLLLLSLRKTTLLKETLFDDLFHTDQVVPTILHCEIDVVGP